MRGFSNLQILFAKGITPMSDAAYLDQADTMTREMTRMRSRRPGDTDNTLRGIAREYKLNYGFLWSLRYRRRTLKIISISVYEGIRSAYRNECEKQMRKLGNEIAITESITGPDHAAVRAAKALLGTTE